MQCCNQVAKFPNMTDTTIAQLHRSLVDALRRSRPGSLHRPVTVAEIYQDLLPYRAARMAVGFEMNADYEHALLRLLAGEGDYARIEPREVRDKLRLELDSPNPNVGVYRNYAACDVWISVDEADEQSEPVHDPKEQVAASWEDEFLGEDIAEPAEEPIATETYSGGARFEIAADEQQVEMPETESTHDTARADVGSDSCTFCGADLPIDRIVNFCPFCGTDQSQQPCPGCGELLDPLWRYCVSCGTRVRPLGDHVN